MSRRGAVDRFRGRIHAVVDLLRAAWVVASELLALFTGFLGGSRSTSSALGVLAVMVWMNIGSQVLFFGAELCRVVATQEGGPPQDRVLETRRRP